MVYIILFMYYVCIYIYILCCAFVGLDNELYKMHGTYSKIPVHVFL